MEAPITHTSFVKVHFGDKAHKEGLQPVNLSLVLDFFSTQEKKIRQAFQDDLKDYKVKIPSTAFVFKLTISNGNSSEVAEKLNNSVVVKNIKESSPSQVIYYGHGNNVYIVISGQQISAFFEEQQINFAELKNESLQEAHQINLNIVSHNDLNYIAELIKTKSGFGWLDQLQASFEFSKTKLTSKMLTIILQKLLGFDRVSRILQSFKKLNVELNCSSSNILDSFPKVSFGGFQKKDNNQVVAILTEAKIEEALFYVLNPTFFLKGNLKAAGFATLLSTLYQ